MKLIKWISAIGYFFILLLLGVSISLSTLGNSAVDVIFSRAVTGKIAEELINQVPELGYMPTEQIQELISDNPYMKNLAKEYLNAFMESARTEQYSLEKTLDQELIQKNLDGFMNSVSNKLSEETGLSETSLPLQIFEMSIPTQTKAIQKLINVSLQQLLQQLTPEQLLIIQIYAFLSSVELKAGFIIIGIFFLTGIVIIRDRRTNALMTSGKIHLVVGILWLIFVCLAQFLIKVASKDLLGTSLEIDLNPLWIYGGILSVSGLFLYIIGKVWKNNSKKQKTGSR